MAVGRLGLYKGCRASLSNWLVCAPGQHRGMLANAAMAAGLLLDYHNPETILFTTYPYALW